MKKKKEKNLLDYIPAHNPKYTWDKNEKEFAVIHMQHKGIYNKIAQKFFHTPPVSHIELDELGTFIWEMIDGKKTLYELSEDMKKKFGTKAEPIYDRLISYIRILHNNKFIYYYGKDKF